MRSKTALYQNKINLERLKIWINILSRDTEKEMRSAAQARIHFIDVDTDSPRPVEYDDIVASGPNHLRSRDVDFSDLIEINDGDNENDEEYTGRRR
jgi:hypothetical protein